MKQLGRSTIFTLIMALSSSFAYGHGEDRPGPHGGIIRMPGAFHTEIKQAGANAFEVFLLDMEWKNPVVSESRVTAKLKRGNDVVTASCAAKKDRFVCKLPKKMKLRAGDSVTLNASRQGLPGIEVDYPYPFKVGQGSGEGDHSGH